MYKSVIAAIALITSSAANAASQSSVSVNSLSFQVEDLDTSDFSFPQFRPSSSWTVYEIGFDYPTPNEVLYRGRLFDAASSIARKSETASASAENSAQRISFQPTSITYTSDVSASGGVAYFSQTGNRLSEYSSRFYARGPWDGSPALFDVGPKTRVTISAHVELSANTSIGGVLSDEYRDPFEFAGASLFWEIFGIRADQTSGMLSSGSELIYASATATDWDPISGRYMKFLPQSKTLSFDLVATVENRSSDWKGGSMAFSGTAWGGSQIPEVLAVPETSGLAMWSAGLILLGARLRGRRQTKQG